MKYGWPKEISGRDGIGYYESRYSGDRKEQTDEEFSAIDLLYKTYTLDGVSYGFIDMCIVVIEGANRDMGTIYTLLNEVIVPNIQRDHIYVVINQADVAMKGRHWNYAASLPDSQLVAYLEEQASSIQKRVKEATGISILKPVYYSAEYGYNVKAVFDLIIDHMPSERRALIRG